MQTRFTTVLRSFGNHVGIVVPSENLEELKAGKHPPIKVQVNEYQSTITSMDGLLLIPFAKEHREKSGFKGGDSVIITLSLESKNRDLLLPEELAKAIEENQLAATFAALAYSIRKEFIRQVVAAKREETRVKRIQQVIDQLKMTK